VVLTTLGGCDGYRKHGVEEGAGSLAVRKELTQGGAVGGVHADSMFSLATGVAIQDYDACCPHSPDVPVSHVH